MTEIREENQMPIACDMTVLTRQQREVHRANTDELFALSEGVEEKADGYAFQLPNEASVLLMTARFIQYERLCCPFFTFGIEVSGQSGPLWLRLSGGPGVKEFIESDIVSHLRQTIPPQMEP